MDSLGKFSRFAVWNGGKVDPFLEERLPFLHKAVGIKKAATRVCPTLLSWSVSWSWHPCKAATTRICPTLLATVVIKKNDLLLLPVNLWLQASSPFHCPWSSEWQHDGS